MLLRSLKSLHSKGGNNQWQSQKDIMEPVEERAL